jgi:hypothetical protein
VPPVMLQEPAAQRVKDMIAQADASASDSPVRPATGARTRTGAVGASIWIRVKKKTGQC